MDDAFSTGAHSDAEDVKIGTLSDEEVLDMVSDCGSGRSDLDDVDAESVEERDGGADVACAIEHGVKFADVEDVPKHTGAPVVTIPAIDQSKVVVSPFMPKSVTGSSDNANNFYVGLTRPDGNCGPNAVALFMYFMEALSNPLTASTFDPDTKSDNIMHRSNLLRCMVAARCNDGDCMLRSKPSADTTEAQRASKGSDVSVMDLLALAYASDDRSAEFESMGDNAPAAYATRIARHASYWGETEFFAVQDMVSFPINIMTFQRDPTTGKQFLKSIIPATRAISKRSPLLYFCNLVRTGPENAGHYDLMVEPLLMDALERRLDEVGNKGAFDRLKRGMVTLTAYHHMRAF